MTAFGKHRLLRKLGTGGMAEAYLAEQPGPGGVVRTVVLKRVLPHLAEEEAFTRMLVNEARLAARLHHPNVARTYDLGQHDGTVFLTMEYVDGVELATLTERAEHRAKGPLGPGPCVRIALDLCAGLHHAHLATDSLGRALGLVHRDVSPENVMISREGVTKLIDFGVAKATALGGDTRTGAGAKGKHGYMSPEQARSDALDARSDQFSVGVILWELLTGRRLFLRGPDYLTMRAVVEDEAPPIGSLRSGVPAAIDRVVEQALEKDPDERYPSCEALADDLEAAAQRAGWDLSSRSLARLVAELDP
jgi:serine/threonine-protein kinase